jgi:hypothetical protein
VVRPAARTGGVERLASLHRLAGLISARFA